MYLSIITIEAKKLNGYEPKDFKKQVYIDTPYTLLNINFDAEQKLINNYLIETLKKQIIKSTKDILNLVYLHKIYKTVNMSNQIFRRLYFLSLLINFCVFTSIGQPQEFNSVTKDIVFESDNPKIEALLSEGLKHQRNKKYIKSLEFYIQAQLLVDKKGNNNQLYELYTQMGMLYKEWKVYERAITYFSKALEITIKTKNKADIEYNIACCYKMTNKKNDAILYFTKALNTYIKQKKDIASANTLNILSDIYNEKREFDVSLQYSLRKLAIYKRLNDSLNIAGTLNNIGLLYKYKKDYDNSIKYLKMSLVMNQRIATSDINIYSTLYNIGVIEQIMSDFKFSIKTFKKALGISLQRDNKVEIVKSNNYLALAYANTGDFNNAKISVNRAVKISKKENMKELLADSYKIFSEINRKSGSTKKEVKYYKLYASLQNELLKKEKEDHNKLLEHQFKINKLENEIELFIKNTEISEMEYNQFQLTCENSKKNNELIIKDNELQVAKFKQNELEKLRIVQSLLIQTKELETEKKERTIKLLQKEKELKELSLQKNELEAKKKLREIKYLKKETEFKELSRNVFIIIAILSIIVSLLIFKQMQMKLKNRKEIIKKNKEILATQKAMFAIELENIKLKKEKLQKNLLLEKENKRKLKNELTFKKKQLTTYTLLFIQKNKILQKIRTDINKYFTNIDNKAEKYVGTLVKFIDKNINHKKDLDKFRLYFEQINKDFFNKINKKIPLLTTGDLQQLALCKLNLSVKDASTLMAVSPNSVKVARFRLSKKIKLPEGKSLREFANTF